MGQRLAIVFICSEHMDYHLLILLQFSEDHNMKKIIFKEDEIKDIIDMYNSFVPIKEICKKYDVCK